MRIDPGSLSFSMWKEIPIPFYFSAYFFDIVNPDEILKGEKPQVRERGPYVYREFRHKRNITFNDNDTVSYREYRNFQFQPDMSNGLESDYIVMPNILALVRLPRRPARAPCPRPAARTRLARRGPFAGPACGSGPTPPGEFPRRSTASGLGVLAKVLSFPWQSTNLKCPGGANGRRRGTPRAVSLCHCGEGASRASELCSESQQ